MMLHVGLSTKRQIVAQSHLMNPISHMRADCLALRSRCQVDQEKQSQPSDREYPSQQYPPAFGFTLSKIQLLFHLSPDRFMENKAPLRKFNPCLR
jgi:hypothetical protein